MKVLLVNHLLDKVSGGGTAERTYQLAKFMQKAGATCEVLTLDLGISDEILSSIRPVKLITVPCINKRYFLPWFSFAKIKKLIDEVDIVLLSGHWTALNAIIFVACSLRGCPYLFAPAGALKVFGRSARLKYLYNLIVGKKIIQRAAACIAITESEKLDFISHGVPPKKINLIPNGIDMDDYQVDLSSDDVNLFKNFVGMGAGRFLLYLGRLNVIKGPDILLEAFVSLANKYEDLHLVMAGPDDGMLSQLKNYSDSMGLTKRVHFPGYVGGKRKVSALMSAAMLIIPSRHEAMSIVVLEGGACSCPVIFSDACGLEELALDHAGVMVPPTVSSIATAIENVLSDPVSARSMAARLENIVRFRFSWLEQANLHLNLANYILNNKKNSTSGEVTHDRIG